MLYLTLKLINLAMIIRLLMSEQSIGLEDGRHQSMSLNVHSDDSWLIGVELINALP